MSMGSGAAEGLQEVLSRLYLEATTNQQRQQQQQQTDRQSHLDAENARRWEADHALRQGAWDRTVAQDRTKAETDAADTAARRETLDTILNDPTLPAPARNLLRLGQYGMGANLNVHALESPDAHQAHVAADAKADDDRTFASWKQQQDYTEQLRAKRPVLSGRLVKDDPAFPVGVQSHLAQIRSRHGDFESALGEFVNSLEQHRQAHPNFQPQKAITALQAMYAGGGRPGTAAGGVDALVAAALGGAPQTSTGRGAGPGARSSVAPAGGAKAVSLAELQAVAQARGTTVEQERARATAAGYAVR